MKENGGSKNKPAAPEPDVLTEVAQKVGAAVGTVVSVLSGTSKSGTSTAGANKKTAQGTNPQPTNRSSSMGKTSKRRSGKRSGSSGTEHSPLKRRRIKSR